MKCGSRFGLSRLLFETLTTLLPVDRPDESHPSITIWRQAWPVFEEILAHVAIYTQAGFVLAPSPQSQPWLTDRKKGLGDGYMIMDIQEEQGQQKVLI